jgi:hypothetical protein
MDKFLILLSATLLVVLLSACVASSPSHEVEDKCNKPYWECIEPDPMFGR